MKKTILFSILVMSMLSVVAQEVVPKSRLFIGAAGGVRINHMRFSELNKNTYPSRDWTNGGVFSVFVDFEFGNNLQYALRPEFDFSRRGGRLSNINNEILGAGVTDQTYNVAINYWDFRMPVMYNFLDAGSMFRPYVFVAPIIGFPSSGDIQLRGIGADGSDKSYKVDASKSNLASTYFAMALGGGVKCYFPVGDSKWYVGVEAAYEHGFTDTYSDKEKQQLANVNTDLFGSNYQVNGSRKFSGFEFKLTIGIPISVFDKKKTEMVPVVSEEPIDESPEIVETNTFDEVPCNTLDDIIDLMTRGESVKGLVICAVDDINFDFNKSEIKEESYEYLDKLASTIIRMNSRIEVKGHTDSIGADEVNMRLSRQRAKAVVDYLVDKGVDKDKISYSYYGATMPLVSNETLQGRRLNRRVEIEILQ